MADRVVELLESPDLSARISAAALERASSSKTRFVQDWKHILEAVVDLKPRRTRLRGVTLDIETLRVDAAGSRRPLSRGGGPSFVNASGGPDATLRFAGKLTVDARANGTDLGTAELTLSAVHAASGTLTDLPLQVRRDESQFTLKAEVSLAQVVAAAPIGGGECRCACCSCGETPHGRHDCPARRAARLAMTSPTTPRTGSRSARGDGATNPP